MVKTDLAGRRSYARAVARSQAKKSGGKATVRYRGSGGKTETVTVSAPSKKAPSKSTSKGYAGKVSSGMSTAEKLISQNPAVRKEGQSEASKLSSSEQTQVLATAKNYAGRGYQGTVQASQVKLGEPQKSAVVSPYAPPTVKLTYKDTGKTKIITLPETSREVVYKSMVGAQETKFKMAVEKETAEMEWGKKVEQQTLFSKAGKIEEETGVPKLYAIKSLSEAASR